MTEQEGYQRLEKAIIELKDQNFFLSTILFGESSVLV